MGTGRGVGPFFLDNFHQPSPKPPQTNRDDQNVNSRPATLSFKKSLEVLHPCSSRRPKQEDSWKHTAGAPEEGWGISGKEGRKDQEPHVEALKRAREKEDTKVTATAWQCKRFSFFTQTEQIVLVCLKSLGSFYSCLEREYTVIAEEKKIEKGTRKKEKKIRSSMTTALMHFHRFVYAYMLHKVISPKEGLGLGHTLLLRPRRKRKWLEFSPHFP